MREQRRRGAQPSEYYYRRELSLRELLPAVGVGVAAGVVGFYLARILFQRTPYLRETSVPTLADERDAVVRRPARPSARG